MFQLAITNVKPLSQTLLYQGLYKNIKKNPLREFWLLAEFERSEIAVARYTLVGEPQLISTDALGPLSRKLSRSQLSQTTWLKSISDEKSIKILHSKFTRQPMRPNEPLDRLVHTVSKTRSDTLTDWLRLLLVE